MGGSQRGPWHTTVPKTTLPGLPPSSPTCSLSLHCLDQLPLRHMSSPSRSTSRSGTHPFAGLVQHHT